MRHYLTVVRVERGKKELMINRLSGAFKKVAVKVLI